ncbi:MAG: GtrA family protein [Candidatus Eremiobacteraeota bacterium]|nr:GtrA family protein [Candidatus Eremiobacteraeota bacterium]
MTGRPLVRRIAERRGVRQFVKFGIVGASGFVVNLIVFSLLQHAMQTVDVQQQRYTENFSIAFLSGGVSNYFLNRIWTFRSSGHAVLQGMQFLAVSAIALAVGLIVSHFAEPYFGPGHKTWLLATLSGIVVNFFVNKYWTFREV